MMLYNFVIYPCYVTLIHNVALLPMLKSLGIEKAHISRENKQD